LKTHGTSLAARPWTLQEQSLPTKGGPWSWQAFTEMMQEFHGCPVAALAPIKKGAAAEPAKPE
jgi:hypothetical protein